MAIIFFGSWFAQSVTGWTEFNQTRSRHHEATTGWLGYLGQAEFWEGRCRTGSRSFSLSAPSPCFAVYLRQRGSPESKPVGEPHDSTGAEG